MRKPYFRNGVLYERIYEIILYEESENLQMDKVFQAFKNAFPDVEYYLIYHDKDIADDGTIKKPHYHLLIVFNRERSINALANTLSISPSYITWKENLKGSVQYLIHLNNPEKHQYDPNDVITNADVNRYIAPDMSDAGEDDKLGALFDFIDKHYFHINKADLQDFARSRGLWGCYRLNKYDLWARLDIRKSEVFHSTKTIDLDN